MYRADKKSLTPIVREIMTDFARITGLDPSSEPPRRYLWTDAFAVCNFLELWLTTNEEKYKDLALKLVDQVHHTLGRHREDDPRKGWISRLDEESAGEHPTLGGLRIGKQLNERKSDDPVDEALEWEQDGQYFHYLTKWMHALHAVSIMTGDLTYNRWAMELAKTAYTGFVRATASGGQYMHWKMSIDLSYPLVSSMGHHDPLDGFITFSQLQATADRGQGKTGGLDLKAEIAGMAAMCQRRDWTTDDTLGLGGLLSDSYRAAQLIMQGTFSEKGLPAILLKASLDGLAIFVRQNSLQYPVDYRLAFRELGLSIGLHAVEKLKVLVEQERDLFVQAGYPGVLIDALMHYNQIRDTIESFWLKPAQQKSRTWLEHRDINMVMLATSLAPDGYLTLDFKR